MDGFLESAYRQKLVLDVSSLPHIKEIFRALDSTNEPVTIYIPDTFKKLLDAIKENENYRSFLDRLVALWTDEVVDFSFLTAIINDKKIHNVSIELATLENSDPNYYDFAMSNFKNDDLITNFSAPFNLLGDVIGKTIGTAKKLGAYVLMKGSGLFNIIKDKTTVLIDGLNEIKEEKMKFFGKRIPGILRIGGVKWAIGIVIGVTGFALSGHNPAIGIVSFSSGMALRIIDP